MKMMSYNVSRSHNINTYDYIKIEAPILREMVGCEEFTREEYERKSGFLMDVIIVIAVLDWTPLANGALLKLCDRNRVLGKKNL